MMLRRFRGTYDHTTYSDDLGLPVSIVRGMTGLDDDTLTYLVRYHFVGERGVLRAWDELAVAQCLLYHELYGAQSEDSIMSACQLLRKMPRDTWAGESMMVGTRGASHAHLMFPEWFAAMGWSVVALDDIVKVLEGDGA